MASTDTRDRFPLVTHTLLRRGGGELLLLRRANSGYLDGYYVMPGGHVQAGETIVEAAVRECAEETGIVIAVDNVRPLAVLPYLNAAQQGVDFVMGAHLWEGEPRINEPERFDDLVWAAPQALPVKCAPYLPTLLTMVDEGDWFHEFLG
jgi:8-oxo-dGTP pyrophosphatase MutT (NUDIX family)